MIRGKPEMDVPRMKTILVVPWDEERGGVVSVVENLARYLQSRGHEVLFFHPGTAVVLRKTRTSLGFPGIKLRVTVPFGAPRPIRSALAFPFLFPIILFQLLWFLHRERVRIINVHYPFDSFFYFALCRRLLSLRLVTSLHGADVFNQGKPKDRYSQSFKLLLRSSDLIILPSEMYRRRLVEVFPDLNNRTILIHNGVDSTQFGAPEERREPEDSRYLLCIAALAEWKGIDVLLHAAKPLLTSDKSLQLVLAGDGPLREELESLARSLGIRAQTQFLGNIGAQQVTHLLHGCEMLILPSREDNFPLVVLEAMVCAKPVVATEVGGIPEMIEHEVSGLLVSPDDPEALTASLRRILSDSDLKRNLAANGYHRAIEHFSLRRNGSAYEAAFASLLGHRAQPSSSSNVSAPVGIDS